MNESERAYYNQRAPEYDDWYRGAGLYGTRPRPGWDEELAALVAVLRSLKFKSILDAACGTGYLTRYLPGRVAGLDYSHSMLLQARARLGGRVNLVRGDALRLPFRPGSFECIFAGHFYGHLTAPDRLRFLDEAAAAPNLLIVDAAWHEGVEPESTQDRVLNDGSRHKVYKRYFTGAQLAAEMRASSVLHEGRWFVAALRSRLAA